MAEKAAYNPPYAALLGPRQISPRVPSDVVVRLIWWSGQRALVSLSCRSMRIESVRMKEVPHETSPASVPAAFVVGPVEQPRVYWPSCPCRRSADAHRFNRRRRL